MKGKAIQKFIIAYSSFIFFMVFLIGSGIILEPLSSFSGFEITPPAPPDSTNPIIAFVDTLLWVTANMFFFFNIMTLSSSTLWITLLIFSPAVVIILYAMLKLARGGG